MTAPCCSMGADFYGSVVTMVALRSVPNVRDRKQCVTRYEFLSGISQMNLATALPAVGDWSKAKICDSKSEDLLIGHQTPIA